MMRIIFKIFVVIIVIFSLVFVCAYFVLKTRGKQLLEKQLAQNFDAPVSIEAASITFPVSLKIKNLDIEDFLRTDLNASINPLGLFSGRLILNKIVIGKPRLTLSRERDGTLKIPLKQKLKTDKPMPLPIIFALDIRDGNILIVDKSRDAYYLNIYDIDVKVRKRGIDLNPAFNFDASAYIGKVLEDEKNFTSRGWIDLAKKDMDGDLEIKDLDTDDIFPFYKGLFGENVSGAKLNFDAEMKARANDLKIDCHLKLTELKPKEKEEEEENHKDILALSEIFDIFSSPEGKIELNFVIHTKLDNPKFDKIDFGTSLFEAAAKNILSKPKEEIVSTVEEIGKDFKDLGREKVEELKEEIFGDIIDIFK